MFCIVIVRRQLYIDSVFVKLTEILFSILAKKVHMTFVLQYNKEPVLSLFQRTTFVIVVRGKWYRLVSHRLTLL